MKYHCYIFFSSSFSPITRKQKKDFLDLLTKNKKVVTYGYSTLGLKTNSNILLWFQSDELENIQNLLNNLMHTRLGQNLKITYTLFGMTRPTQYSPKSQKHLETKRHDNKYLVIYPFTKIQDWYKLDFEKRRNLMWGHVQIGKKHPKVEQLLLYSYGVDDSEFIVSYETDDLSEFQALVMELRSDKVREYTLKDTPIFTCIYKPLKDILNYI
jgi:chlorite dismutase